MSSRRLYLLRPSSPIALGLSILVLLIPATATRAALVNLFGMQRDSSSFIEAHRGVTSDQSQSPELYSEGLDTLDGSFQDTVAVTQATASINTSFHSAVSNTEDHFHVETSYFGMASYNVQMPDESGIMGGKGITIQSSGGGFIRFVVTEPARFTITTSHQLYTGQSTDVVLTGFDGIGQVYHSGPQAEDPAYVLGGSLTGTLVAGEYRLSFTGGILQFAGTPMSNSGTIRTNVTFDIIPEPSSFMVILVGGFLLQGRRRNAYLKRK